MQIQHSGGFTLSTVASVQEVTARNLHLLQTIESTVNRLSSDAQLLNIISRAFDEVFTALKSREVEDPIDPDGIICAALRKASDATSRMYGTCVKKRQSAAFDKRLREDDGVVDAYDGFISEIEAMHDLIEEIIEWIDVRISSLDAPSGIVYTSVDDLVQALNKK
jgi:hypothetical protein